MADESRNSNRFAADSVVEPSAAEIEAKYGEVLEKLGLPAEV